VFNKLVTNEGEGDVARILADLSDSGFSGVIAIEPHMVRGPLPPPGFSSIDEAMKSNYVEYGRRTEKLLTFYPPSSPNHTQTSL
jgi:sugar phosphate isomerase/epimerase